LGCFFAAIQAIVLCFLEMGVMPEIAQAIEEMDWRLVRQSQTLFSQ